MDGTFAAIFQSHAQACLTMYSPEGYYRPYSSQTRRASKGRPPGSVSSPNLVSYKRSQSEARPGPSFPLKEAPSRGSSLSKGRSRRREGRGQGRRQQEPEPPSPTSSWRSRGIPEAPGSSLETSLPTQVRRKGKYGQNKPLNRLLTSH